MRPTWGSVSAFDLPTQTDASVWMSGGRSLGPLHPAHRGADGLFGHWFMQAAGHPIACLSPNAVGTGVASGPLL